MRRLVVLLFFSLAVSISRCQEIHTIVVSIVRDGVTSAVPFSSSTYPDELVRQNIRRFCSSIEASDDICEASIYARFAGSQPQKRNPWSNHSQVAMRFTADIMAQECSGSHPFQSRETCYQQVGNAARSVKMIYALQLSYKAEDLAESSTLVDLRADWRQQIEGNTFGFMGKVKALQNFADDPRVQRICEVGFNFGHSSINWLVANPTASVLAFDITRTLYTSAGINAIYSLFPGRTINLVTGDSAQSIPSFSRLLYGSSRSAMPAMGASSESGGVAGESSGAGTYNLLFIDGNHQYEGALSDIVNLRPFANATYHRLIIDDGSDQNVRRAWVYAVETLRIVRLLHIERIQESMCMNAAAIAAGPLAGSFEFKPCSANEGEEDQHFDDLIIGEYIL